MVAGRAVSSWSLHRTLGRFFGEDSAAGGGRFGPAPTGGEGLSLLELPAALKARGYDTLQLCHFHLPSRDGAYLETLRSALVASGITLDALLVDDGDVYLGSTVKIARVPVTGGTLEPVPLAAFNNESYGPAMAADGACLYYISGASVLCFSKSDGSTQRVATIVTGHPSALAHHGTDLYIGVSKSSPSPLELDGWIGRLTCTSGG